MRRRVIAAVWKDKLTNSQSIEAATKIVQEIGNIETNFDILLVPSAIALADVSRIVQGSRIQICAQYMDWKREAGSYIGEITAAMLKDVGCPYLIVGHSERRRFFNETDETINKRVRTALDNSITPIICIGVDFEEREAGLLVQVLEKQIKGALARLVNDYDHRDLASIIFAFEPVWAISTWRNKVPLPEPGEVEDIHKFIRSLFSLNLPREVAEQVSLLYGGSVDAENGPGYYQCADVDGALVGGASLSPDSFVRVVKAAKSVYDQKAQ